MKTEMGVSENIMCPKCHKICYHRRKERVVFECDNCGYTGFGNEGTAMSTGDYIRSLNDADLAYFLASHSFEFLSSCPEDGATDKCLNYLISESSEFRGCLDIYYSERR